MNRRIIVVLCLVGVTPFGVKARAAAEKKATPHIVVSIQMEPLPNSIGLHKPESLRARKLAADLRTSTVKLLNTEYPFMNWVAAAPTGVSAVGTLEFVMKCELGIGDRVYLEAAFRAKGHTVKLDYPVPDVYPKAFKAPPASHADRTTLSKAESVIRALVVTHKVKFEGKLTSKIALAKERKVVHQRMILILPLLAEWLLAGEDSIILVKFQSKPKDYVLGEGKIELNPAGPYSEEDNPLHGRQMCDVKSYRFPGFPIDVAWEKVHEHIASALKDNHLIQPTLRIYMQHYERSEPEIDFDY